MKFSDYKKNVLLSLIANAADSDNLVAAFDAVSYHFDYLVKHGYCSETGIVSNADYHLYEIVNQILNIICGE